MLKSVTLIFISLYYLFNFSYSQVNSTQKGLKLIWSEEFNYEGPVSPINWNTETIPPNNGSWWNQEKQHYTGKLDNAYVSDGTLKIIAKKERYTFHGNTKEYTSARINTKGKFEFKYGRIDVRAKLPEGAGTWAAIWMLGTGNNTVKWPECGEADIMEHWGHIPGVISSATHTSACSGSCKNAKVGETYISDYSTKFHIYSMEWSKDQLKFFIDNEYKYSYNPPKKTQANWPFNRKQYIILNIAMGGRTFEIDSNFKQSTMEIDYIRVYQ